MNLVNRGFVFVRPRAAFVAWARQIDPEMLIDEHAEGSIYLIEEEFWDDELVLKNYAKKINNLILKIALDSEVHYAKKSKLEF